MTRHYPARNEKEKRLEVIAALMGYTRVEAFFDVDLCNEYGEAYGKCLKTPTMFFFNEYEIFGVCKEHRKYVWVTATLLTEMEEEEKK